MKIYKGDLSLPYYCPRCKWHYSNPKPVTCRTKASKHFGKKLCDGCVAEERKKPTKARQQRGQRKD